MVASREGDNAELQRKRDDARTRTAALVALEDLPDEHIKPPENVLFVCKLNPVTTSEDLEPLFARFGDILSCEVIKDWKTG